MAQHTTGHQPRCWLAFLTVTLLLAGCANSTPTARPAPTAAAALSTSAPTATTPSSTSTSTAVSPPAWRSAGILALDLQDPQLIPLQDERVLVVDDRGAAALWSPATNSWRTTAALDCRPAAFVAVPLTDGRVLAAGGFTWGTPASAAAPSAACGSSGSSSRSYLFDPRPGHETWAPVSPLGTPRSDPAAAVLQDGRVLVAGGYYATGPYVPGTTTGTAPDAALAAYRPTAAASQRGPVADAGPVRWLVALATAEIFDPATGTWSPTGPLHYGRLGAASVTLADGRVLVVGGDSGGLGSPGFKSDARAYGSAEIYDPRTGRFTLTGGLSVPPLDLNTEVRHGTITPGSLVALPDGGALVVARGWTEPDEETHSYRYDAQTGRWSEVGRAFVVTYDGPARSFTQTEGIGGHRGASVACLPDGRVLAAGGESVEGGQWTVTSSAALYDPATNAWSSLPPMPESRAEGVAVSLADRSVLIVGGYSELTWGPAGLGPSGAPAPVRFVPSP